MIALLVILVVSWTTPPRSVNLDLLRLIDEVHATIRRK